MTGLIKKSLNNPEDTQTPEKLKSEVVVVDGVKIQRVTVAPGWHWSEHLKPVVGGDSCQLDHLLYMLSGNLRVKMEDGSIEEFGPGDVGRIPPGHDGWNIGSDDLVWLEIPH